MTAVSGCNLRMTEAYWEPKLKPWDQAAGALVVEEAGGTVTTMDGRAFSVFDRSVLVSNTRVHQQLLDIIEPVTTELIIQKGVDLSPFKVQGYKVHTGAQLE